MSDLILNRNIKLPKKFILDNLPKPRDQKMQGSCVPFALCYHRELFLDNSDEVLSPAFLYYQTRLNDKSSVNEDNGCSIVDALETLKNDGVCLEKYMPYNEYVYNVAPNEKAYSNAKVYKIHNYINIDNGIIGIENWLVTKKTSVVFGMECYDEFNSIETSHTGRIPIPKETDKSIGKHCVNIVGFEVASAKDKILHKFNNRYSALGYFYIFNSYGSWCKNGVAKLPFEYLNNMFDFYVVVV